MKPRKLILCGWGPYKEKQEIDFDKLDGRGLFLITGPTGAGKTTIFDAITYALYGSMSGEMREKNSVRSDFAGEDIPTYVELSMTHAGEVYHIYRNPEYLRPKKRKTGTSDMTREKERAYLTLPTGEKIEGSSEVTGKMQEILRLDYKQFKQLSLIAQGEFAKLLTASSSEKSHIFREIFDTELYDRIAGLLRARSNNIYKQVIEYRHKMEEDLSFFHPMEEEAEKWQELTGGKGLYYDEILSFLKQTEARQSELLSELEQKNRKAEQEADILTMQVTEAERVKSLFERRLLEQRKGEELALRKPQMAKQEEKLYGAQQALLVKVFEQAMQHASLQTKELLQKNTVLEEEIKVLTEKHMANESFVKNSKLLEAAYEREQQGRQLQIRHAELVKTCEVQQTELVAMQKKYLEAESAEIAAKAEYETADRGYRHAMAGILAKDLEEDMPCPVCGSLHHPDKAEIPADMPTGQEVEDKKLLYEEKRQISLSLHGKTAACKERTEGLWASVSQLQQELEGLTKENEQQDGFVKEYLGKVSFDKFTEQKKECEMLAVRLQEKEALYATQQEEIRQKISKEQEAKEAFIRSRMENGFDTEEAYRQAFLSEGELKHLREELTAYREAKHANEELLLHLEQELAGKEPADIPALCRQLEAAKGYRDSIRSQLSGKSHYVQDISRLLKSLQQKNRKKQKLEEEYGIIKRLDDTTCGNNRLRLVFEQYVLAAYFEEILKAANIRLRAMTAGRYELRRVEAVGDGRRKDNLEMEVMDYYTGKYRSVKTLSGGESFKTSLALALGMSDVVQALSGGMRVEALFIDEGFGSLDSESLEQASLTLQSLVEKDRLIGIISHAPELAEKITDKIRIHKTNAGSSIEIMVS